MEFLSFVQIGFSIVGSFFDWSLNATISYKF